MRLNSKRTFTSLALFGLGLGFGMAVAACGGDDDGDDFEDIRSTATAVAERSPSPGPTVDPLLQYYTNAAALAAELAALVDGLQADMLAAATTQADPKWPQVLTADADLVIQKATSLDGLPVAGGVPETLSGKINQACDGLAAGAALLKEAILKLDPALGAQAATTLDASEALLAEVRTALEAGKAR